MRFASSTARFHFSPSLKPCSGLSNPSPFAQGYDNPCPHFPLGPSGTPAMPSVPYVSTAPRMHPSSSYNRHTPVSTAQESCPNRSSDRTQLHCDRARARKSRRLPPHRGKLSSTVPVYPSTL